MSGAARSRRHESYCDTGDITPRVPRHETSKNRREGRHGQIAATCATVLEASSKHSMSEEFKQSTHRLNHLRGRFHTALPDTSGIWRDDCLSKGHCRH